MVTDPVEQIRTFAHDTPFAGDLARVLTELAALPPSLQAPYLTVGMDWRPDGSEPGRRPARRQVQDQLTDVLRDESFSKIARNSIEADFERIITTVDGELDAAAQGLVVVACHHRGVFVSVPLDVPVATRVTAGPIPSLRQLAHAADGYPPFAVLVAEQREANLWLFERRTWRRAIELDATDHPRKQQQGGWSQRRYQARADERVEAFARTIAEETRRALDKGRYRNADLVIAADEPMASALDAAFHETIKGRIIGRIHLELEAGIAQIAEEVEPLVDREEQRRELQIVQAVRDGAGSGGRGAAGSEDTLTALQNGQVLTLVINDDFAQQGWADYTFPLYGVGDVPKAHPAGGDRDNLVPTALEDEVVRLAIQTDATVKVIRSAVPVGPDELEQIPDADAPTPRSEPARTLDEGGGVGAVLRYAIDADRPTPEL